MSKPLPSTNDQYDIAEYILRKFGVTGVVTDDDMDRVLEYIDFEEIARTL